MFFTSQTLRGLSDAAHNLKGEFEMTTPINQDPRYKTEFYDGEKIIPGRKSCANALEIDLHFGLWPETITDTSDNMVNALRHLHGEIKGGWSKIAQTQLKAAADDSEWPKRRREASESFAETTSNALEAKFKDVQIAAQARLSELQHEMECSLDNNVSREIRLQEIRASIKAMSPDQRNNLLRSGEFQADEILQRAVATGHELTTGIGAETIRKVRSSYLEKSAPHEWYRVEQIKTGLDLIEKAKSAFIRNVDQYREALPKTIPDLHVVKSGNAA